MKTKSIVTGALLLFVGASLIYLVAGESPRRQTSPPEIADRSAPEQAVVAAPVQSPKKEGAQDGAKRSDESSETPKDADETSHKVVAYYFHGTRRCLKCQTIEAYTEETLKSCFAEQMDNENLTWIVINLSEADNEHFIQDFELSARNVVLVEMQDEKQVRWKQLTRVWELVRDKQAFTAYIRDETKDFLGE